MTSEVSALSASWQMVIRPCIFVSSAPSKIPYGGFPPSTRPLICGCVVCQRKALENFDFGCRVVLRLGGKVSTGVQPEPPVPCIAECIAPAAALRLLPDCF